MHEIPSRANARPTSSCAAAECVLRANILPHQFPDSVTLPGGLYAPHTPPTPCGAAPRFSSPSSWVSLSRMRRKPGRLTS